MTLKKSFTVSFLLHVIPFILLIFFFHGGGAGKNQKDGDKQGGGKQDDFTSIIPMYDKPKEDVEMSIVTKGDIVVKAEPTPVPSATPSPCNRWYGGIGIEYGRYDDTVDKVPPGYPAANAGIQVGDVVLPAEDPDIRGPIGTPVKVYVIRGELRWEMTLIRGKICESDIPGHALPPMPSDGVYGIPHYSTPGGP